MSKRIFIYILFGVLAAGLVCLVTGLCVYFTTEGNAVSFLVSLFTIFAGAIMAGIAALALLIILIVSLIKRAKNK